jgi:hypothetical protein
MAHSNLLRNFTPSSSYNQNILLIEGSEDDKGFTIGDRGPRQTSSGFTSLENAFLILIVLVEENDP